MRRLLLLIAALLMCGACTPGYLAQWTPESTPDKQHVVLFGDSLSWGIRDYVIAEFAENPNIVLSHNSFGATRVDMWMDEMAQVPSGSTIVVALGTNDTANLKNDLDIQTLYQGLDTLTATEPDCIVWLTLNTETADQISEPRRTDFYEYNAALRSADDNNLSYPDLVLQDWEAISDGHTDWFKSDTDPIHYNPEGAQAFGNTEVDAINRC